MNENPDLNYEYQVGGSLPVEAPTYVKRQADRDFYQGLKAGEFCYVLNSRQMGKSSLRVQTMAKLQQEGFACAGVDITSIGTSDITPEEWYFGIIDSLVNSFELYNHFDSYDWWTNHDLVSPVQRFSKFIPEVLLKFIDKSIVIFVDEIDSVLALPFNIDDFFALIRDCFNQRADKPDYKRLTFALIGVAAPSDLISNHLRTPFNIGRAIELTGFQLTEAQPLAVGLETQAKNSRSLLKAVLYWTGGQPFLTQKTCKLLLNYGNSASIQNPDDWVANLVREKVIQNWEGQDEPEHLKTIRDRILRSEQRASRLLGLYQQILQYNEIAADDTAEQMELRLTGLVVKQADKIKVYNPIYQAVFNRDWVEKQLANLRPYNESFNAWKDSDSQDESRLLRGQALQDAQTWAAGKSLSNWDYQFLNASRELQQQAVERDLEAQRQANQLLIQANQTLAQAQKKAIKIRTVTSVVAGLALLVASVAFIVARNQVGQAENVANAIQSSTSSLNMISSGQPFQAVLESLKAGKALKKLDTSASFTKDIQQQVIGALKRAINTVKERNSLEGHFASVNSVAISPDGKTLASASADKTIKLWNLQTHKLLATITGHTNSVYAVSFSPNGKLLATGSDDNTVKLWDTTTGKQIITITGHTNSVNAVSFSPDGKLLVTGSADNTVKLWDTTTGKQIITITGHTNSVNAVSFSPDGKTLASASYDNTIKLWNLQTQTLLITLAGHSNWVNSVAFSPDGKTLASGSSDNTIKLWNLLWDRPTPKLELIETLTGHSNWVNSVSFSPNGKLLATGSADKTVQLWGTTTGKQIITLTGHKDAVNAVSFSPNGKLLATGSADNTVKLWDTSTGKEIKTITGHTNSVNAVSFSPNGKLLVTGSADNTVKLWDTSTGKEIKTITGHTNSVYAVSFSPDGKLLTTGSADKTVKLWDTTTGKEIKTLTGHTNSVNAVSFSPDGKLLVTGSADNTVKLWDTTTGKQIKTITGHTNSVHAVSFSPDDKLLASASDDKTMKLWNLQSQKPIPTLTGHSDSVNSVAFSPDGLTLASASSDNTIKLWIWDLDKLMALGCNRIGDYLRTNPKVTAEDKQMCADYLSQQSIK
ncbi:WD40 domain-containing protein [Microcoleus sp. B7-D4]|uniref:WD40 domain-containing protein n=1 Tax=Microcoleus sp. B7-D4 TaxID=2818696 RepID=UPI002FCEFEB8